MLGSRDLVFKGYLLFSKELRLFEISANFEYRSSSNDSTTSKTAGLSSIYHSWRIDLLKMFHWLPTSLSTTFSFFLAPILLFFLFIFERNDGVLKVETFIWRQNSESSFHLKGTILPFNNHKTSWQMKSATSFHEMGGKNIFSTFDVVAGGKETEGHSLSKTLAMEIAQEYEFTFVTPWPVTALKR